MYNIIFSKIQCKIIRIYHNNNNSNNNNTINNSNNNSNSSNNNKYNNSLIRTNIIRGPYNGRRKIKGGSNSLK